MREEPRGHWYLLTGALIGLAAGLIISLVLSPLRYTDSDPSALREVSRNEMRLLIALAFQADGNIPRAQERLGLLHDADPNRELAAQAQRILGEGGSPDEARALAGLAGVLSGAVQADPGTQTTAQPTATLPDGAQPTAPEGTAETPPAVGTEVAGAAVQTATPPRPSATPRPTFTPRATSTPPRVLDAPFILTNQVQICDGSLPPGRLAVEVSGRDGQPLAGVPAQVTWGEGQSSTFYTGLAPEISPGYADFQMQANVTYTLKVGEASEAVTDLEIPSCGGGWRVEFKEGGG